MCGHHAFRCEREKCLVCGASVEHTPAGGQRLIGVTNELIMPHGTHAHTHTPFYRVNISMRICGYRVALKTMLSVQRRALTHVRVFTVCASQQCAAAHRRKLVSAFVCVCVCRYAWFQMASVNDVFAYKVLHLITSHAHKHDHPYKSRG